MEACSHNLFPLFNKMIHAHDRNLSNFTECTCVWHISLCIFCCYAYSYRQPYERWMHFPLRFPLYCCHIYFNETKTTQTTTESNTNINNIIRNDANKQAMPFRSFQWYWCVCVCIWVCVCVEEPSPLRRNLCVHIGYIFPTKFIVRWKFSAE